MALEKKTGGIRPIVIAAKCAINYAIASLSSYLQPIQLGVGTPVHVHEAAHYPQRV